MLKVEGRYLITGGTGFLGQALIRRLLGMVARADRLVVLARNEGGLMALKSQYPDIEIVAGDVADPVIARKACQGVDGIFHLAAFKHVTLAEKQAWECVRSNVEGLGRILQESLVQRPDFVVFISTDKAAQVRGVYGATKFIGEKMVAEFTEINPATKYFTIRYGNVFRSTGSFIYKWETAAREGREIVITDPEATRFFFPVDQAVDLILNGVRLGAEGVIIPTIKAVKMGVILDAFREVHGDVKAKVIGLQAGENKHETMDGTTFSDQVPQFTKEEFIREFLCPTK